MLERIIHQSHQKKKLLAMKQSLMIFVHRLAALASCSPNMKEKQTAFYYFNVTHRKQHGINVQCEFDTVIKVDALLPFFIRRHDEFQPVPRRTGI